ncbi:MAG: hypothetical protein ACO1OX_08105 [Novosphingobium sp.]
MAAPSNHLLGIDPKMYRHFAVITVALSSVVALFANGDAQEAIAATERHGEAQAAKNRAGQAKLVDKRSDRRRSGSGNSGFSGPFGAPMDGSGNGSGSVIPAGMAIAPAQIIVEVDQQALARMTPEQRAAYLKTLEEERQKRLQLGPVMPTPEQVSALAEQSAMRSGSDEID